MIREILTQYIKTKQRPRPARKNTVGASTIGTCIRKNFFQRAGTPVDGDYIETSGASLRGSVFETREWTPALRAHFGADKVLYAGSKQCTFIAEPLSATPDSLIVKQPCDILADLDVSDIGTSRCFLIECKSIDPRATLDQPKAHHLMQVNTQLGLIRATTSYKPQWAVISYIDASLYEVTEFAIAFDQDIFEEAKVRATKILTASSADGLKPEGWISGGKECDHCPFTRACGRIRHAVPTAPPPEPIDPQFVAEIADMAREAKARRALMEAATEDLREIEHQIKERLRAKGHRVIKDDNISVVWSAVKGRPSWNMPGIREAAERAGIDLSEYETVGDPSDRLVIKSGQHTKQR